MVFPVTVMSATSFAFPTLMPCHPGAVAGLMFGARFVMTSFPMIETFDRSVVMPRQSCPPNVLFCRVASPVPASRLR